jgi:phosphoglycerate kinase
MRSVRDMRSLGSVPVLVRAALNEPLVQGAVASSFRLQRAVPTLRLLADQGARVVVISHIDPPAGAKPLGTETLSGVAAALAKLTRGVSFSPDTIGPRARQAVRDLAPGRILVMENLRRDARETANDPSFAQELAALGDAFVEDSFDTCHRLHASIVGVPKLLPAYAGLQLEAEVATLEGARAPVAPSLAVIGGAKFASKEAALTALIARYDHVFAGGAFANDFLKAAGHPVGQSLVSGGDLAGIRALLGNERLVLPVDSLVVPAAHATDTDARAHARVAPVGDVRADEVILDHGPATSALLAGLVQRARTVLWNGPLGDYENGFADATDALARAIADSSAHSVVGGGDTVTAVEELGLLAKFSFVSTGGGAMLSFLASGTLPGIEALG